MNKNGIINYLKEKKEFLHDQYGIKTIGLYGSYARDEANESSDVDIFYERDETIELKSGLEFLNLNDKIAKELHVPKVDLVSLEYMNPIVKHYAKKDFIYI